MLLLSVGCLALPRLLSLDFSAQGRTRLPAELQVFPGLLQLDFSFNRLTDFEPPPQLSQLQMLDLDANQLTAQPESLKSLKHLTWLSLQGNQLTTFSGLGLGRLYHLDLEANYLKSIEHLEGMPGLRELNISSNEDLRTLPASLQSLRHLILLDASGIGLEKVGPELQTQSKLQDLDLSRNQLQELPGGIGRLTSLVRLDVSENQLTRLPPELGDLRNLQYLSVNHNAGLKLDKSVAKLKRLKALYLDRESLPDDPGVLLVWLPNTAVVLFERVNKEKGPR